jgi:hypothetical protein
MVMLREVLSPSAAIPALVEKAVRPKAAFLLGAEDFVRFVMAGLDAVALAHRSDNHSNG